MAYCLINIERKINYWLQSQHLEGNKLVVTKNKHREQGRNRRPEVEKSVLRIAPSEVGRKEALEVDC